MTTKKKTTDENERDHNVPTIIYSPSAQLIQVEDFPTDCERTVKGALHVRPGSTAIVSDGEAAHLKQRGIAFSVSGPKAALTPAKAPAPPDDKDAGPSSSLKPAAPSGPPQALPGPSSSPFGSGSPK